MMDLASLEYENRKAARRSAQMRRVPVILEQADLDALIAGEDRMPAGSIPYIGNRAPLGWKRVKLAQWFPGPSFEYSGRSLIPHGVYLEAFGYGAFFVDTSGFGAPGEPALTIEEFAALARPGFGYGLVETGQFQAHIGVFERRAK